MGAETNDHGIDPEVLDASLEDRFALLGESRPGAVRNPMLDLVASGRQVQQIKAGYHTAVAVTLPRDTKAVIARAMQDAALLAERGFYSFPAGGGRIEGPSSELVLACARAFGNCVVESAVVDERAERATFKASFIDLETGFTEIRSFTGAISPAPAKFAEKPDQVARWRAMQMEAAQSRAQRGVLARGLPGWLVIEAMKRAKKAAFTLPEGMSIADARKVMVDRFKGIKVPLADLERVIGRPLEQWSAEDCVNLKGTYQAIKEGEATVAEVFGASEPSAAIVPPTTGNAMRDLAARVPRRPAGTQAPATAAASIPESAVVREDPDADPPDEPVDDSARLALLEECESMETALPSPQHILSVRARAHIPPAVGLTSQDTATLETYRARLREASSRGSAPGRQRDPSRVFQSRPARREPGEEG